MPKVTRIMDENALSVSLEEFGLSKYEARVYVALISKGAISAGELAYYSEVPRTKVYQILLKLQSKKLAIISKGKPITCTPIAPEDAFDEVVQEQIHKVNAMNTLVSSLKKVNERSRKSRGSEEKRYFHLAANSTLDKLRSMLDGTKKTAHMMADQWGLGLLAECREQIILAQRRGVDVRILIASSQIGSEAYKMMPDGAKIRASDTVQNCFVFDETELLLVDSSDGKGAMFSSTDILGACQLRLFSQIWKGAIKTDGLADMTKVEAQEICRMIRLVGENALGHVLDSSMISKNKIGLLKILEKHGISIRDRSIDDVIELVDAALQTVCSGHANFDAKTKNISIESKLNSGHSLPWAAILDEYLQKSGYKTRITYQSNAQKGERVYLKFGAQD